MLRLIGRRLGGVSLALTLCPLPASAAAYVRYDPSAFAQAQAKNRTIVVETYAFWCLACRLQAPILNRLRSQDEFKHVLIFRIGEDAPKSVWKRFGLHSYGMLVIFKGAHEVARGAPKDESTVAALLRKGL